MKKTFKTMISAVMAVTMLAGSAVIPVSAQDIDNTKFQTIDDVKEFYSKIDEHFDEMSEEDQNIFAQYLLDTLGKNGFKIHDTNDNESGAVTALWAGYGTEFVGAYFDDCLKYVIHNGEAYISRFDYKKGSDITEYTIPDEINGYPVVGIGAMAFSEFGGEKCSIKKIIIPNTVRRIARNAFAYMDSLEEIELSHPDEHSDLQVILGYAFDSCSSLKEVSCFADSDLQLIEYAAFLKCTSLENFIFPDNEINIGAESFLQTKLKENENFRIPSGFVKQIMNKEEEIPADFSNEYLENTDKAEQYNNALMTLCYWYFSIFPDELETTERFTDYDFIELADDIDFDGKVTVKDLAQVKRHLIGDTKLNTIQRMAVNKNINDIDIRDAARISRKIVGLDD